VTAPALSPALDRRTVITDQVRAARHGRDRRRALVLGVLLLGVVALYATTLMVGQTVHSPGQVLRVLLGEDVPGASFTIGTLRLPRATLGLLAGLAFGVAGVTLQTILR
jgi:iron complex transport system permease protein